VRHFAVLGVSCKIAGAIPTLMQKTTVYLQRDQDVRSLCRLHCRSNRILVVGSLQVKECRHRPSRLSVYVGFKWVLYGYM
jgi:hypothetical protein